MKKILNVSVIGAALLALASCGNQNTGDIKLKCEIEIGNKYYSNSYLQSKSEDYTGNSEYADNNNYIMFNEDKTGIECVKVNYTTYDDIKKTSDYSINFKWSYQSDGTILSYFKRSDVIINSGDNSSDLSKYSYLNYQIYLGNSDMIVKDTGVAFYSETAVK